MGRREHSASTRDVLRQLANDGWYEARKGPRDHVQFRHPTKPGRVTLDIGSPEQTTSTLRSIYRQAEWEW
jgi:predicted RNA binding protein YcfA (HicA-like mRNA interferase family)